jgi:hypothetical protein
VSHALHLLSERLTFDTCTVDYMWRDEEGNFQTGPTTSPENSYEILKRPVLTDDGNSSNSGRRLSSVEDEQAQQASGMLRVGRTLFC